MTTSDEKINDVKLTYDQIASDFSDTRNYLWPDIKPFIEKVKPNSSFLDVGCGNGRLLIGLPENTRYTGLDISSKLLALAEVKFPNRNFIETDITKPSIWKHLGKFDYIYSIAVFHHLPDRQSQIFVLKQIKEHLKPKGRIVITIWNLWQKKYLKYHLDPATKWQNPHWVYIPFKGKRRFCFAFTRSYINGLLKEAGLKLQVKKTLGNYLLYN